MALRFSRIFAAGLVSFSVLVVAQNKSSSPLATVTVSTKKRVFKMSESIRVQVSLQAGEQGVYVAKSWGFGAGGNTPGFDVLLFRLDNPDSPVCPLVAADSALVSPLLTPQGALQRDFFFLASGNSIGTSTEVCSPNKPGKYKLIAKYFPFHQLTKQVARLPETKGLVLDHEVTSEPVYIELR